MNEELGLSMKLLEYFPERHLAALGADCALTKAIQCTDDGFEHLMNGGMIVLGGACGTGKTVALQVALLRPLAREFLAEMTTMEGRKAPGTFDKAGYLQRLIADMDFPRYRTAQEVMRLSIDDPEELQDLAESRSVLGIDDFGAEFRSKSTWTAASWDALIDTRYRLGLPTIITTNQQPAEMRQVYGERIFDRLVACSLFFWVKHPSLRKELTEEESYRPLPPKKIESPKSQEQLDWEHDQFCRLNYIGKYNTTPDPKPEQVAQVKAAVMAGGIAALLRTNTEGALQGCALNEEEARIEKERQMAEVYAKEQST